MIVSGVLFCILALGGTAYGLRMTEMPASMQTKVTDPVPRFLTLKLPLQQETFHWTFMKKDDFLAGKLVLNVTRGGKKQEIVIFENGKFAEGWGAPATPVNMKTDAGAKVGELYFQFESQKKYDTAPGDEVELVLTVKKDLDGIGPMNTGVLTAGEYRAKGRYSGLIDEYQVSEQMKNMPKETVDKLRQVYSNKAFLENWQEQWPLRITGEQGWLSPQERENLQNTLKQMEKMEKEQAPGAKK